MDYEHAEATFEAEPSRPAPGPNTLPSLKVIEKLGKMQPAIAVVKIESIAPIATDTES